MERMKSSLKRLLEGLTGRSSAIQAASPDELPHLDGKYDHENYPCTAVAECLDKCSAALQHISPASRARDIRARLDQLALTHDALAAELADFARRAEKLSSEILALTAAAKPLQEPGIGPGDRSALRDSLSAKADELQVQRDAYESDARAYDERISDLIGNIEALRNDICTLAKGSNDA